MDGLTTPALVVFLVGGAVLAVSTLAMQRALPEEWEQSWWRRRRRTTRSAGSPKALGAGTASRRAVTGAPAARRLATQARPARQLRRSPDDLRRERERLRAADSRAIIEDLVDRDPQLVAQLVDQWLTEEPD